MKKESEQLNWNIKIVHFKNVRVFAEVFHFKFFFIYYRSENTVNIYRVDTFKNLTEKCNMYEKHSKIINLNTL